MTDPIIQNNSERLDDKDVVYSVSQRFIGNIVIVLFINKVVKWGLDHISRKVRRSFHYSRKMK